MKNIILLAFLLAPLAFAETNLYADEVEEIDNDKDNHSEDESEEINDFLEDKIKDYLKGKIALNNGEDDSEAANPLEDLLQEDNKDTMVEMVNDIDNNYGHPEDDEKVDEVEDSSSNDDGHGGDHIHNVKSPEQIDENLDGKVIDKKGNMILQGDIVMTKAEEKKYFDLGDDDQTQDEEQQDVAKGVKYWPNAIVPYVIEGSLQGGWWTDHRVNARKAISAAVGEFNEKTCIRLVPRKSQANYISFFRGSGCYSPVGMRGGKQQVSLGNGCQYKATAIHEVMHSLGFWHEQSRPDRDSHVTINWNNIENLSKNKHNFAKYKWSQVEAFGHPYDYRSIMHYAKDAFGKKNWIGQKATTISPKRASELGQCSTCGMSQTDNAQLIRLYCSTPQSRVPSHATLNNELKMTMAAFRAQNNDVFRKTLLAHLQRRYTNYYWTVSSYNAVGGYSTHAFRGYCGHVWRYHNKNVVACYSKKSARVPSATKRNQIATAVLNSAKDKGCDAKAARDRAYKVATSYGYPIAVVHNVRHGSGLRTQWHAHTYFWNYRCQRICKQQGWWATKKTVCTNHMSSLILMFGGP